MVLLNQKGRNRVREIRDELELMMVEEKKKKDNLFESGASMQRIEEFTKAVVGLEISVSVLGDLVR